MKCCLPLAGNVSIKLPARMIANIYLVDERNGKKKPIKMGLAPAQRDGMEYEFTVVLDLSVDGHVATAARTAPACPTASTSFRPKRPAAPCGSGWKPEKTPPRRTGSCLKALKARADAIGNVAHLNDWWRVHSPEIALLSPKDQARLTAHCAVRKAAILQALQEAQAGRMASVPLLAASSPAGRGNRKATHERTLP